MASLMEQNEIIKIINTGIKVTKNIFTYFTIDQDEARKFLIEEIKNNKNISALERAAMISNCKKIIKEYTNQINVYKKAMQLLEKNSKKDVNVDEEWLDYFFDRAKNVSNRDVQEIFARLFVQECTSQGSVHKKIIDTLSLMDAYTAIAFSSLCKMLVHIPFNMPLMDSALTYRINVHTRRENILCPLVIPDEWDSKVSGFINKRMDEEAFSITARKFVTNDVFVEAFKEYKKEMPQIDALDLLEELGLVRMNDTIIQTNKMDITFLNKCNKITAKYENKLYSISPDWDDNLPYGEENTNNRSAVFSLNLGTISFTNTGRQLASILEIDPIKNLNYIVSAYIADCAMQVSPKNTSKYNLLVEEIY